MKKTLISSLIVTATFVIFIIIRINSTNTAQIKSELKHKPITLSGSNKFGRSCKVNIYEKGKITVSLKHNNLISTAVGKMTDSTVGNLLLFEASVSKALTQKGDISFRFQKLPNEWFEIKTILSSDSIKFAPELALYKSETVSMNCTQKITDRCLVNAHFSNGIDTVSINTWTSKNTTAILRLKNIKFVLNDSTFSLIDMDNPNYNEFFKFTIELIEQRNSQ